MARVGTVGLAEEVRGGVEAGESVEPDEPGPRLGGGSRLVEPHMPGPTDAQQLDIDSSGGPDRLFVGPAVGRYVRRSQGTVGNVGPIRLQVDVIEEMLPHEAPVALERLRVHGEVLVQVEGGHAPEAEPLLTMQANQLFVDRDGGGAGGQAQDGPPVLHPAGPDEIGDLPGHISGRIAGILEDGGGKSLPGGSGLRRAGLDCPSSGRPSPFLLQVRIPHGTEAACGVPPFTCRSNQSIISQSAWKMDSRAPYPWSS